MYVTNSVSKEPLLAFGSCRPSVAPWSEPSRLAWWASGTWFTLWKHHHCWVSDSEPNFWHSVSWLYHYWHWTSSRIYELHQCILIKFTHITLRYVVKASQNISVSEDGHLSFSSHINNVVYSCFAHFLPVLQAWLHICSPFRSMSCTWIQCAWHPFVAPNLPCRSNFHTRLTAENR